jgi:hypothetical protein
MKRGEKDVSPSPSKGHQTWNLLKATKLGTFQGPPSIITFHCPPSLEPSKGHQHWNLPLATKLGSSFASFFLLLFKSANLVHLFSIF